MYVGLLVFNSCKSTTPALRGLTTFTMEMKVVHYLLNASRLLQNQCWDIFSGTNPENQSWIPFSAFCGCNKFQIHLELCRNHYRQVLCY